MKLYLPSEEEMTLPLVEGVKCGFPSPAEDFSDMRLNITEEIVKNPASTFYARVSGNSMINDGIGCLLYTSDAADDLLCVVLGGRRIIKKKDV